LSRASVQMAINHLVITFSCHYLIIAKYFCHL
jgi:hypothetical protein